MNKLVRAARQVQELLTAHGIRFCFIGGFAVQRHAEPRVTRDVDVSVMTGLGNEGPVIDVLMAGFAARRPDAREFAMRARVLLLRNDDDIGIDATLTALPYEVEVIDRSTEFEFAPGVHLRTCSAEDLLVLKIFAGRPIDWRDVEMILRRHGRAGLDLAYVDARVAPLVEAKGEPDLLVEYARLRERYASG